MPLTVLYNDPDTKKPSILRANVIKKVESNYVYEVSQHPIERGEDIADHHTKKPMEITINIIVPEEEYLKESDFVSINPKLKLRDKGYLQTKKSVLDKFKILGDYSIVCDIRIDEQDLYEDMLITNISNPEDERTGNTYDLSLTFSHAKFVQAKMTQLDPEILKKLTEKEKANNNYSSSVEDFGELNATNLTNEYFDYLQKKQEAGLELTPDEQKKWRAWEAYRNKMKGLKNPIEFPIPITEKTKINSPFGWRQDPVSGKKAFHGGIDIATLDRNGKPTEGIPIRPAKAGKVIFSGYESGYGHYIVVEHGANEKTLYAHMRVRSHGVGDWVTRNSTLGYSGSTGKSTGPHLHFEYSLAGKKVDPSLYFSNFFTGIGDKLQGVGVETTGDDA